MLVAVVALIGFAASPPAGAQSTTPPVEAPSATPAVQAPGPDSGQRPGQVLFSRSEGAPAATAPSSAQAPAAVAASVTNAMRAAPQFLAYDFTVHLDPAQASLEVQVRATLRNTGTAPLAVLPLQLSSSLHFEQIRDGSHALRFAVHTVASDADHTGALTEAAVELPQPLAPGAQLALVIDYGGSIPPSSTRLDRIGAPAAIAARTDWDRISEDFTGLRGFGDSVWYPVSSVPARLSDGAALFGEIARQKRADADATVSMHITVTFPNEAPNVVVLDGHAVPPGAPAALPTASFPGVFHAVLPPARLGFGTPSLVMATRTASAGTPLVQVEATPPHALLGAPYAAAATLLEPMFHEWFGAPPAQPLLLVDLPVEEAALSDDGDAELVSISPDATAETMAASLAAPLTHVYFHSPAAWLEQGVSGLMNLLWIERAQGRDAAVASLGGGYAALALAEPASPGTGVGQPLPQARDAVFLREKATSVLWMLRLLVGDAALGHALRAYDPKRDNGPGYFQSLVAQGVAAQGAAALPGSDSLGWFFHDWIENDEGLPDLSIANVFSSRSGSGDQWLIAIDVKNSGYAAAWVPVTVHTSIAVTTVSVLVPARGDLSRRILVNGEPTEVDVNDGSVPEVQASTHRRVLQ